MTKAAKTIVIIAIETILAFIVIVLAQTTAAWRVSYIIFIARLACIFLCSF